MTNLSPLNLGFSKKEVQTSVIPNHPTTADLPPASEFVGSSRIGSRTVTSDGDYWSNVAGFIPTKFKAAFSVTTNLVIDSIAEWVSKLKITNSGAATVYVSWATTALDLATNLNDFDSSTAVPISAGESFTFTIDTKNRFYGIVAVSGTNAVSVVQGI